MAREEMQMFNKVIIGLLALALVLAGASGGYTFYLGEQLAASQEQQAAEISALHNEMLATGEETLASIDALDNKLSGFASEMEQALINAGQIYEEVSQSIVRISDGENVLGSGFVFDSEGHILTNNHVVKGHNLIYIISADGRTAMATIIGTCEYSDVAVLSQSLPIPALTLADSSTVKAGEPVIVIGSPFGLPATITSGVISQTDQVAEVTDEMETIGVANIIQFDAAVNFGNSGGPLLNPAGEAIGMVIARIDPDLGDGVYWAISSNKVSRVAQSIIEQGYFDYPWLGVEVSNLTPKIATARNLETINGAWVRTAIPANPAEAAGVMADDIIVAIDGTPVQDVADLTSYLGEYATYNEEVTLTLIRYGIEIELPVTMGKRVD
jgi:S1-C subfamily serine protease